MEQHNFKKKYGQNFLRNAQILEKIVASFCCDSNSKIIEIGPGDGALTIKLLLKNVNVYAFEIDISLKKYLDKIISKNLKIIYGDFLKQDLKKYISNNDDLYVIANVPYYITTPIITKFIEEGLIPKIMVLMVQKEVALRLSSMPKNSNYGAITVILNYFFDIVYLFDVGRENFYPIPNVDSAIIKLTKRDNIINCNFSKYKKFVYDAFKQKRKNLKNNLKGYDLNKINSILENYGFNLNNRAEELSYEIFIEIVNNL